MSAYNFVTELGLDSDPNVAKRLDQIQRNRRVVNDRSTTHDVLHSLHNDNDIPTRIGVARHLNAHNKTLQNLSQDPSSAVRWTARQVLNARRNSQQTIQKLQNSKYDLYSWMKAVRDEFALPEVLDVTADHYSSEVRRDTAIHHNVSDATLQKLAQDRDRDVSSAAIDKLRARRFSVR